MQFLNLKNHDFSQIYSVNLNKNSSRIRTRALTAVHRPDTLTIWNMDRWTEIG